MYRLFLLQPLLWLAIPRGARAEDDTTVQLTLTRRIERTVYPDYTPTPEATEDAAVPTWIDNTAQAIGDLPQQTTPLAAPDEQATTTSHIRLTLTKQLTATVPAEPQNEAPTEATLHADSQMNEVDSASPADPETTSEPIVAYFRGEALTVGGDAKTVSGEVVSLASSAIHLGSNILPLPGSGATANPEPTVDSQHSSGIDGAAAITPSSPQAGIAIGTAILTAGGILSVEGGIVSLGSGGDIVVLPSVEASRSVPAVVTGSGTSNNSTASRTAGSSATSEEVVSVVKLPPLTAMLTNTSTTRTMLSTSMPWWASTTEPASTPTSTTVASGAGRASSSRLVQCIAWVMGALRGL